MGKAPRRAGAGHGFSTRSPKGLAKGTPLGLIGTAEEFANLACFLASEQSSYITGTAINVDGGQSPVV